MRCFNAAFLQGQAADKGKRTAKALLETKDKGKQPMRKKHFKQRRRKRLDLGKQSVHGRGKGILKVIFSFGASSLGGPNVTSISSPL